MLNSNYLIIGLGKIGLAVANQLSIEGAKVTGLARGEVSQYDLLTEVQFMQADALHLDAEQIKQFTHISIIVTPDTYNAPDYKNTYLGIAQHIAEMADDLPKLERIVFISSTGVYGQDKGEWIDETVLPEIPKREASVYIFKAEQVLQTAFAKRAVMIRPSGIYGKQRLMRICNAQDENKKPLPLYAWTNRVMDSDLVNIIVQVLMLNSTSQLKPVYLATDFCPVTSYELTCWLANKLDSKPPSVLADSVLRDDDSGSDPNLDFDYGLDHDAAMSGKRLHSNIPLDWLQYPDWKSGYNEILKALSDPKIN